MSLAQELESRRLASSSKIPKDKYEVMQASTLELQNAQLSAQAFKTGQTIPAFELPNVHRNKVSSVDLLKNGPLVISFYRGGWCPYCNMELRALQSELDTIRATGGQLVAISPEMPDHSLSTSEKNELSFEVLSDLNNQYAKQLGLVFQLPENLREVYHSFNIDVPKHNGNTHYELPMPATYLVDEKGKIIFDFVPEDYTYRLEPQKVVRVLQDHQPVG
ncbi:MAG: peroxiredoxin-like family protein [Bacteroidota bacterium]